MKELEKFECGLTLQEVKRIFEEFSLHCGYTLADCDYNLNYVIFKSNVDSDLEISVDLQLSRVFKYEGSVMEGWAFRFREIKYLNTALAALNNLIEMKKTLWK